MFNQCPRSNRRETAPAATFRLHFGGTRAGAFRPCFRSASRTHGRRKKDKSSGRTLSAYSIAIGEHASSIRLGYADTLSGPSSMQVSTHVESIGIGYGVRGSSHPGARAHARVDLILDTRYNKPP